MISEGLKLLVLGENEINLLAEIRWVLEAQFGGNRLEKI